MEESLALILKQTLQEKMNNGGFKRGELKKFFLSFAEQYGKNPETVKSYYYRVLKKELENDLGNESANTDKTLDIKDKDNLDSINNKEVIENNTHTPHMTKIYTSKIQDIHSYLLDSNSLEEWINLIEVFKYFSGKAFKEFVKKFNAKMKYFDVPNEVEVVKTIEKEELLNILIDFSKFTRVDLYSRQAKDLYSLLHNNEKEFDAEEVPNKENELDEEGISKYKDSLSIGDVVTVKVVKIMGYGAFVEFIDCPQINGFIHISEILNGYVEDINDYFHVDQIMEAKIIKTGEKLSLSTRELNRNTSDNSKKIQISSMSPSEKNSSISTSTLEEIEANISDEWPEVVNYIKSHVGPLSPIARDKLKELIQKYGLFKFTIGLNDVAKDFTSDLGLLMLSEAESKLRDGL
ncbi:S1 RNA-binding domain-containing protein [Bacillus mexicanus]|uniref:S1 RNA-binding domain-containing protein n=1 Tax=Bacillus mexicanus TaxID=2834415 RepID=UPI003D259ADC